MIFKKSVMPHLGSKHRFCRLWTQGIHSHLWRRTRQERRRARLCLWEGTRFLLSMNQFFCAPAKLSARHSSLCFGQRKLIRPASCDVVLLPWTPCVTVCATVPSAQQKTLLSLQPQQPGYQLKSLIRNNSLLPIFKRDDDLICFLTTLLTKAHENTPGNLIWKGCHIKK